MAEKIVYFSVYDPICEVLRGSKYTSRDEADRALAWWQAKLKAEPDIQPNGRWDHLELAIVTIERLPQKVHKAAEATTSVDPEPFQTE